MTVKVASGLIDPRKEICGSHPSSDAVVNHFRMVDFSEVNAAADGGASTNFSMLHLYSAFKIFQKRSAGSNIEAIYNGLGFHKTLCDVM